MRNQRCFILAVMAVSLTGCSLLGTGSHKISGAVAPGVAATARAARALALDGVDAVCVFPAGNLDGSWPGADLAASAVEYPLEADGTFSATLGDATLNWVYLLVDNDQAARKDRIRGFLALDAGDDTLLQIQSKDVVADIECGVVTGAGDEAVSSYDLSDVAGSFEIDTASLTQIAARDNILKSVWNNYVNYDPDTGIAYLLVPRFNWYLDRESIRDTYFDPAADPMTYDGYYPQFSTTDDGITLADLVDGSTLLELYPPTDVTVGASTFGPDAPFDSAGSSYTPGNGPDDGQDIKIGSDVFFGINFAVDSGTERADGFSFRPPDGNLTATYAGIWTLDKNGETVGWFDLSVASPVDAGGKCTLYTPSVKATTNADGVITRIDVRFTTYDEAYGWTVVTDTAGMNAILGSYMLGLMSGTTEEYHYASIEDAGGMVFTWTGFEHDFDLNTTSIQIGYDVAGVNLNFWWN